MEKTKSINKNKIDQSNLKKYQNTKVNTNFISNDVFSKDLKTK